MSELIEIEGEEECPCKMGRSECEEVKKLREIAEEHGFAQALMGCGQLVRISIKKRS